jgi:hypothetical protein
MNAGLLDFLPLWALCLATIAVGFLSVEAGYRLSRGPSGEWQSFCGAFGVASVWAVRQFSALSFWQFTVGSLVTVLCALRTGAFSIFDGSCNVLFATETGQCGPFRQAIGIVHGAVIGQRPTKCCRRNDSTP